MTNKRPTARERTTQASFDYSRGDASKLKSVTIQSYDFKSQPPEPIRVTGNYGDNAMRDPSDLSPDEMLSENSVDDPIDILHDSLREKVSDAEIKAGYKLSPSGLKRAADHFGISGDDVKIMMNTLRKRLQDEAASAYNDILIDEDQGVRFSISVDSLKNVEIHDGQSGESKSLIGSKGQELLRSLTGKPHGSEEEQTILRNEMLRNNDAEKDFMGEIANDKGSFNFQWEYNGNRGTATAEYSGSADNMKLAFPQVTVERNGKYIKIAPKPKMLEELKKQAIAAFDKV